jgi:very-short-patch-repair endonuclease
MGAMSADDDLLHLASRQHAAVSRRQAAALGIDRYGLAHRVGRGAWTMATAQVACLVGAPATDDQRAMVATLHFGGSAYISAMTALAFWGVAGFVTDPINLLRRRTRVRATAPWVVHTTTDLLDSHITELRGIPIVTPTRALFDIAGRVHPARVERALDNAWSRRLTNASMLARTLAELADHGRPGIVLMRELIEARPAEHRPAESNTEARFDQLMREDGQRPMRRQVELGDADWVGRSDYVDDESMLIVEIQSDLFHGSLLDRRRDALRLERLQTMGWTVLEVWEHDVWHRPQQVVGLVRRHRRAQRGRAA